MYRYFILLFICIGIACSNEHHAIEVQDDPPLNAVKIMQEAHAQAGGAFWRRPKSLSLYGKGIFYKEDKIFHHEKHVMHRVFEDSKETAHAANGKVRIESYRDEQPFFLVTFDGQNTYDLKGKRDKSEADKQWASNFGYGVIRHALDSGYMLQKMPDDLIDNIPRYTIRVIDPKGGKTLFGIAKDDFKIRRVAFDTPRGWHERIYSNFFTKKEYHWQQAGLVRLYYNGIKANEIIWEDFDINKEIPDSLFILNTSSNSRDKE